MRGRTDANQRELVATLRALGWLVIDLTQVGGGCPDLLICKAGQLRVVELKVKGGTLTPAQQEKQLQGWPIVVVRSVNDCLALK